MNELWKRHWTTLVGVAFLLAALATLFKYSADQGWITVGMKLGAGLLLGAAAGAAGVALAKRGDRRRFGEILTGLGAAVWYMTCSYAGIYEAVWEPLTVFIAMTAVTVGVTAYAYRFGLRLLLGLGLAGALLAPLALRPDADHVFALFLYLLVVNAAYFAISVAKSWPEARIGAFAATWLLYAVYYMNFTYTDHGWLTRPMGYASAAFVFYAVAFYAAAWRANSGFAGWNLCASFANTVVFCLWAPALLGSSSSVTLLLLAIGLLYMGLSVLLAKLGKQEKAALYAHVLFGCLAFLIGLAELGGGSEYRPLIGVAVWSGIAAAAIAAGRKWRSDALKAVGSLVWLSTGLYWFVTTWDAPRLDWFGVYVPFLNGGAAAWMLLAAIGFYCARNVRYASLLRQSDNDVLAHAYALLSHLVVGGLLTVQITNAADEYDWSIATGLLLSVVWAVYALLLFLWGAYSRGRLFRWFGSGVLVAVAAKAVLLDLQGEDTLYKILTFAVLGVICFGITIVNQRWRDREQSDQTVKEREEAPGPEHAGQPPGQPEHEGQPERERGGASAAADDEGAANAEQALPPAEEPPVRRGRD